MFEDLITLDDNHLMKLVSHDYDNLKNTLYVLDDFISRHAELLLSKDSPIVQYTVGGYISSQKSSSFYNHFPRKASNLDGEHHYLHVDYEFGRWLPKFITDQLLPQKTENFTAYPVPTQEELALCHDRKGRAYWNRSGIWICFSGDVHVTLDHLGPKYFAKYEEYISWKRRVGSQGADERNL